MNNKHQENGAPAGPLIFTVPASSFIVIVNSDWLDGRKPAAVSDKTHRRSYLATWPRTASDFVGGLFNIIGLKYPSPFSGQSCGDFLFPLGQRSLLGQQSNGSIKGGPRRGSEGAPNTHSSDAGIGQIRYSHVGTDQQNIDGFRRDG